jgi:CubicO group peptidase (beta-lactamase class C family)
MTLVVVLFSLLFSGCCSIDYRDQIKNEDSIISNIPNVEKYIKQEMKIYGIEKASISIFSNNQIIYSSVYNGVENEQFRAASIGKPIVAYAALKLVDEGKLDLDIPLYTYLRNPYFEKESKGELITLRMVLNHTSGMNNRINQDDRNIYWEPGKEFHYSGVGFEYLRKVICDITGISFNDFMKNEVFIPLNMNNSRFEYELIKGKKEESAASGLITTSNDLSKFMMELVNPKHISLRLINEMLTESVKINAHNSWGLGIGIQTGNDEKIIWHYGNYGNKDDIWKSLAYVSVDKKIGAIFLTKGKNGDRVYKDIIHYAIGGSFYGLQSNIVISNPKLK